MTNAELFRAAWQAVAAALIDAGSVRQENVLTFARQNKWPLPVFAEVANALDVEVFEWEGEDWWRLRDKVVPILPNRQAPQQASAQGGGNAA